MKIRLILLVMLMVAAIMGRPLSLDVGEGSPISNSIGDIVYYEGNIYVSTLRGISISRDMGESFEHTLEGIGFSGLTAGYGRVFAASSRDTLLQGNSYPLGSGLYISDYDVFDWIYRDDPAFTFISDPVNPGNIAYDVEVVRQGIDTVIWVPSFYGGLVRSSDMGVTWKQVVPDGIAFDPNSRIAHRHFAFCSDTSGMEPYEYNAVMEIDGINFVTYAGTRMGLFRQAVADGNWEIELEGTGVAAIMISGNDIYVATAHDTLIGDGLVAVGDGLWKGDTGSGDWEMMESAFFRYDGTNAGNLGQDIIEVDGFLWAACFYGGLVKSEDRGESWTRVMPDGSATHLPESNPDHRFYSLAYDGATLWAGSGENLYRSDDTGESWSTVPSLPDGWVAKIEIVDDIIFVGLRNDDEPSLVWSDNDGATWESALDGLAIVDIASVGDYAYASGDDGLWRASVDDLSDWEQLDLTDAQTGLEHKSSEVFGLYTLGDTLFAGTQRGICRSKNYGDNFNIDTEPCDYHVSWPVLYDGSGGGINISKDGGKTWENDGFDTLNGITGEWVVGVEVQYLEDESIVWAVTKRALDSDEENGFSYSTDDGTTWEWTAIDAYGWNFAFGDSTVFAATSGGLLRAEYPELVWDTLDIIDEMTGIRITDPEIVGVQYAEGRLFAGTNQGLAYSDDKGITWTINATYPAADEDGEDAVYAYPSPFSPYIDGSCFIVFPATPGEAVTVTVHDFVLDEVVTVVKDFMPQSEDENRIQWNGRDRNGNLPANGVYFISVEIGDETFWGKVMLVL